MSEVFSDILGMSLDSAWLIIGVIILRAVLNKAPKYFRKILWGLVGLRLVIPFSFKSSFSLVPDAVPKATERVTEQVTAVAVEKSLSFADVLPFLWFFTGITFLVYGIVSYIRLKIKISDGVLLKENIYESEKIQSPFVCGFIRAKIYLPYGLDEETRKCVLQHEKTHIKFGDHIIKALSYVILCIHWFNPLVWVAYFLLCKDIELSCDEGVVKKYSAEECRQYAGALLELGVNKVKFNACPVAFGEVSIKARIKNVISYKKASKILIVASLCLCVGVAVCFMTEPEVKAEEPEVKAEITSEPATEPVTEATTEPVTEASTTEPVTQEPVTEPYDESVVEYIPEAVTEDDAEDNYPEMSFKVVEVTRPVFSYYTTQYTKPDTMRENAEEAGVFADDEEKAALIAALEVNNEETE